jgi:hypothetical protein
MHKDSDCTVRGYSVFQLERLVSYLEVIGVIVEITRVRTYFCVDSIKRVLVLNLVVRTVTAVP